MVTALEMSHKKMIIVLPSVHNLFSYDRKGLNSKISSHLNYAQLLTETAQLRRIHFEKERQPNLGDRYLNGMEDNLENPT